MTFLNRDHHLRRKIVKNGDQGGNIDIQVLAFQVGRTEFVPKSENQKTCHGNISSLVVLETCRLWGLGSQPAYTDHGFKAIEKTLFKR